MGERQLGAVAAGHELSARAGAEALADGGNAVDAAVAAAFAACTAESTLTGVGGAGFATLHLADGTDLVLDFFAAVPGLGRLVHTAGGLVPVEVLFGTTTQTFHVGPQSCAVPGFVAGMLGMHDRFGRLPRTRVLEPGIRLAREGMVLTAEQAYCHRILERVITRLPAGAELYAPTGELLGAGARFRQPELATTLEALAAGGADVLYRGELADVLASWADENDALLTADDLARYRVDERPPVRARYRDFAFRSVPAPSSGGSLVAYALTLLDAARHGPLDMHTTAGARLLVAGLIAASGARGAAFDRYLYGDGLAEWLLGEEQLRSGRELFARALDAPHELTATVPRAASGSTTHISVIDAEGSAVAVTSSTGCGSGEIVPGTGIHLNNMLGEEDLTPVAHTLAPGERLTSMMAPSLLLHEGRPLLAVGSAGSNRLRSAIVQALLLLVESRFLPDARPVQERVSEAVSAPRLHPEAGVVHAEGGYPEEALTALEASGHEVLRWPGINMFFGGANIAADVGDGTFAAAGDPRRGGRGAVAQADGTVVAL